VLTFEQKYWDQQYRRVAGLDEAGRGPLAGPVVAAAAILDRDWALSEQDGVLKGLTDSKQLSESRREAFSRLLHAETNVAIGIGVSEADEIDRINILRATHLAMSRAVMSLPDRPDFVLVDGLPVQGLSCRSESIVKGDSLSLSIAAASVVAKVFRDARMCELDELYPVYGFARHKGYGTKAHLAALYEHGPCPEHRRSFAPVREAEENRSGGPRQGELFG
jgi:ribonuclease HII